MSDVFGTSDAAMAPVPGSNTLAAYAGNSPFDSGSNPLTSGARPRDLISFSRNPVATAGAGAPSSGFSGVASHANVVDLNPDFAKRAQAFQTAAKSAGIDTNILSGYRSTDEQAKLYAKYQAGTGGIAAPPGKSYHESGNAIDMYATDPAKQQWLIENAPKFGIYPGANFGDPGHFQIAGSNSNADHTGTGAVSANNNLVSPGPSPSSQVSTQSSTPDSLATTPSPSGTPNPKGLWALSLLQALAPNHAFRPVDYDPFKVQPKGDSS